MASMVVIGGALLSKLDSTLPSLPPAGSETDVPPLAVFVVSMYCRWVALLLWFRFSLMLVGLEASHQSPFSLLLLCYALAATPIPFAGLTPFPALEVGAHLSIFLSLLLVVSVDGARPAANVLFFLVGAAALKYTVRSQNREERQE